MEVKKFEDNRWSHNEQAMLFRHQAALAMIDDGQAADLGCGDGLFLGLLKNKGITAVGLDISDVAVQKCKDKGLDARVFDFAKDKLPFADHSYDYVVMLDVLEHSFFPDSLLREAKRVSRGFVVLSVPNFNSLAARIQVLLGEPAENCKPNKGHVFWFNLGILRALAENNGLEIVECRQITFWHDKPIIGSVMKALLRILPSVFALSFVCKLKAIK